MKLMACTRVTAIYIKTGGKNGKYSWVPSITNVSSAATLHIQLFRHVFRDRYSQTHNHTIPGMNRLEVISLWQFLCTISTPRFCVVAKWSSRTLVTEQLSRLSHVPNWPSVCVWRRLFQNEAQRLFRRKTMTLRHERWTVTRTDPRDKRRIFRGLIH